MRPIYLEAATLPLAWERAVVACWEVGNRFRTHYDRPGDPESRDVMATIHVNYPFAEPRIHRAFPGGLDDLEKYRSEVLYGVHDYFIAKGEPYTYHERIEAQIDQVLDILKADPDSRRAKLEVWRPSDLSLPHAPCAQYFWFRIEGDYLHMVTHIRSNDAFKAGFMNMYAFTELQEMMALMLCKQVGTYTHVADSFHIYGADFAKFEGFLKSVHTRAYLDRVYTTDYALEFFVDGCNTLLAEEEMPEAKKTIVTSRKGLLMALMQDVPPVRGESGSD